MTTPPSKLKPLASDNFVRKMAALKSANARELHALKLNDWTKRSAAMLGIDNDTVTIGYADKTDDPVEQLNLPLIAKVQMGVAQQEVTQFTDDLFAIPKVQKDKDYQTLSTELMRASEMFKETQERFPGLEETWNEFFATRRKAAYEQMAEMVDADDTDRKLLFEAMASVVSGRVPGDLADYEPLLKGASEDFYGGKTSDLADKLYAVTAAILDAEPPEPPGGGGGGGGDDPPGEDEFSGLGNYLSKLAGDDSPAPETLGAEKAMETPQPEGLNVDDLEKLQAMDADIVIPESLEGAAYVTFQVPTPPKAREAYVAQSYALDKQVRMLRNIVEEYYRVKAVTEFGLKSGRFNSTRAHRLNFGKLDIFKRTYQDSVGHAEIIVLLDESGSMNSNTSGKDMPRLDTKAIGESHFSGHNHDAMMGKKMGMVQNNRVAYARNTAHMLLDVSRQLPGFKVTVAGYSSNSPGSFGPLQKVAQAVVNTYDATAKKSSSYRSLHGLAPTVRKLADTENPYALMTCAALAENADLQAMHWAVDHLKRSSAPQKAIIYLADGLIDGSQDDFNKLVRQARNNGVITYYLNLYDSPPSKTSVLSSLPRTDVTTFKDICEGVKRFLDLMVQAL